jgi:hypothetical protein
MAKLVPKRLVLIMFPFSKIYFFQTCIYFLFFRVSEEEFWSNYFSHVDALSQPASNPISAVNSTVTFAEIPAMVQHNISPNPSSSVHLTSQISETADKSNAAVLAPVLAVAPTPSPTTLPASLDTTQPKSTANSTAHQLETPSHKRARQLLSSPSASDQRSPMNSVEIESLRAILKLSETAATFFQPYEVNAEQSDDTERTALQQSVNAMASLQFGTDAFEARVKVRNMFYSINFFHSHRFTDLCWFWLFFRLLASWTKDSSRGAPNSCQNGTFFFFF